MSDKTKKRVSRAKGKKKDDIRNRLSELALNLWWTWNYEAKRLFEALEPDLWRALNHNPRLVIRHLPQQRWRVLENDDVFLAQLEKCERDLKQYLRSGTWFSRTARGRSRSLSIAYFCAEYAIHESMQMYAGGLGVLAGDHLKSASDLGIPLTAVGLIYRHGYYRQQLDRKGQTRVVYPDYDFHDWPCTDTGVIVDIPLMKRTVKARIWKMMVGRVELYLLDTDLKENRPVDRKITSYLYGGDTEYRINQEIVLGVGGRLALRKLGIEPTVYHLNEGHAAFCALARLQLLTDNGLDMEQASELIRESTVFTTHTPVAAGNDRFDPDMTWRYLGPAARKLGLSREKFLALGRENPADTTEPFCMTVLALRFSERANGVAKLHGETSRKMWKRVYGLKDPERVPIGHVTNGIHVQTWLAPEASILYDKYLKPRWVGAAPDDDWWSRADRIPEEELWDMRNMLRSRLVNFIRSRIADQMQRRCDPIADLAQAHRTFDEKALTIGFARRFATYKRAPLIFRDRGRLAKIMNNADRPVQLVFAGKAHPLDPKGKAFISRIYRYARSAGFAGRVVIIEDYDMHIGHMLTSGCDIWLNNPIRPLEASGTSGMKPPLHGGLNCSILDGWWPEGFNGKNGWAIGDGRELSSRKAQDEYDANCIYDLLENEIIPRFYARNRAGIPRRWVSMMRNSLSSIPAKFSTHRMLADYLRDYYMPAHLGE